jgi:DNA replication protein DnaC
MEVPSLNSIIQSLDNTQKLKAYYKTLKGYLVLTGKNGTGKTYASKAIYQTQTRYILPEYDSNVAIFTKQLDLHENLLNGKITLDQFKKVKLLVIDDLGTRKPTEWLMDHLYNVIDYRWEYRDKVATIITTNLTPENVLEHFGAALYSRMFSGVTLNFVSKDRRRQSLTPSDWMNNSQ